MKGQNIIKLLPGDEIRVISPGCSMGIIDKEIRKIACERLESMGLKVSFSKYCEEIDEFNSSSVASRISDLHDAFADKNVKGILTTIGGYNSNQLLESIDYKLIAKNPKFFCGYSDITALQNALFAKIGLVTYSGPHFSTFGCLQGIEYMLTYFKKCAFEEGGMIITPAETWSDDHWYLDQNHRSFASNSGFLVINQGNASGTIIGGNLTTLNMLQGTEYMPSLEGSILFLEDDFLTKPTIFDRGLQSLMQQKGFSGVYPNNLKNWSLDNAKAPAVARS